MYCFVRTKKCCLQKNVAYKKSMLIESLMKMYPHLDFLMAETLVKAYEKGNLEDRGGAVEAVALSIDAMASHLAAPLCAARHTPDRTRR